MVFYDVSKVVFIMVSGVLVAMLMMLLICELWLFEALLVDTAPTHDRLEDKVSEGFGLLRRYAVSER